MDISFLGAEPTDHLNYLSVLGSGLLCLVCSSLLSVYYRYRSLSLSGGFHIAPIIPPLALITFLVILVIKSSLALSLGLVGALSIIRFRTPIKEPEELVYIFFAIALGLGFGSGQSLITVGLFLLILGILFVIPKSILGSRGKIALRLDWSGEGPKLEAVLEVLLRYSSGQNLISYDTNRDSSSCYIQLDGFQPENLSKVRDDMLNLNPDLAVSFTSADPIL